MITSTPARTPNDPRFVFFSELVGRPVLGPEGARLGRVADLVVASGEPYPPVESLVLESGRARRQVPWSAVELEEGGALRLREAPPAAPAAPAGPPAEGRLSLAEALLDRQIVDVEGAKLVRVNDLHFLVVNGALRLAHVDVGFRGLVRRLGWQRAVDGAVTLLRPRSGYLGSDHLISWKWVQPLDASPGRLRLEVAQRALAEMHPADLAEILEELDRDQRTVLLQRLDVETAADTLEETSPELTAQMLEEVSPEKAADILEEMAPDEAADALGELDNEARAELLEAMEQGEAREVEQLLGYPRRSAGGLMTPDRVELRPGATVAEAVAEIRRRADEVPSIHEVFLVDEAGVLRGVCGLKELILSEAPTPLERIAHEPPATVEVDADVREVAALAAKYNLFSVPVLDRAGVLRGIVTVDDVLPEVLDAR